MNTLKLKNLGVQELSTQEKREIVGGDKGPMTMKHGASDCVTGKENHGSWYNLLYHWGYYVMGGCW